MKELELHKSLIKEITDRANDKYYDTKLIANAVYWILEQMTDRKDELQTIAEDINRRVKNAYRSCGMAEDEPSMEMSGVLTLTEESSNELFRVLEEQDKAYINDVLDGKCGFTIKSADGRSVELVPTQNKRNQRVQSVEACDMCCIQTEVGCEPTDCPWR